MTKEETLERLEGLDYELVEHKAVFTIAEMQNAGIPHPELISKNLFVRDDKKRCYYLISVEAGRKLDLREFQRAYGTRRLSFASEEDLRSRLGLEKGSVTPLGLLEDSSVEFFLDRYFEGRRIGIHPSVNTATVFLDASDLAALISSNGNKVTWLD